MQRKKNYLQRLLAIYIAFFVVLIFGFIFQVAPNFTRGVANGMEIGEEMNEAYAERTPRAIYYLWNIPIVQSKPIAIENNDTQVAIEGHLSTLTLEVNEPLTQTRSVSEIAFSAIGNSPWIYAMMIGSALCFPILVVLMFFIIRSVRSAIREEQPLAKNNAWLLRAIALLTILSELLGQTASWMMNTRAAHLLEGSGYCVDTTFQFNYGILLMGVLLLFSAEIFVIGRDLGEEQKLTI